MESKARFSAARGAPSPVYFLSERSRHRLSCPSVIDSCQGASVSHPRGPPPSPLRAPPPTGREGFPFHRLLLVSPAPAVPVLLHSHLAGFDTEAAQLRSLSQTALQLGEPGEAGQAHDVIPQPHRVLLGGQPADDRPEKGHTRGWLEVDDRRADVLAREG